MLRPASLHDWGVPLTVSYGKGPRGAATRLHSLVVRARVGRCQRCGARGGRNKGGLPVLGLECAHIISRGVAATRTDERNALALCGGCHRWAGAHPVDFAELVLAIIGETAYDELRVKARPGGPKVDWEVERDRLKSVLADIERAA